jgi:hypothetical protein
LWEWPQQSIGEQLQKNQKSILISFAQACLARCPPKAAQQKRKSAMLRGPQHDDCGGFWGVILSLSKDSGVMQSSRKEGGDGVTVVAF